MKCAYCQFDGVDRFRRFGSVTLGLPELSGSPFGSSTIYYALPGKKDPKKMDSAFLAEILTRFEFICVFSLCFLDLCLVLPIIL